MTPLVTIILIIVGVIAGYIFGLIDGRFTSALRKKNETAKPAEDATPQEVNQAGEDTVLKVTMDRGMKWHLELDGRRLEKPEEMSAEERERAVNVVMQMRPWLDGKAARPAPVQATIQSAPAAEQPKPEATSAPISFQAPAKNDDLKISPTRGLTSMVTKEVKAAVEKKPTSIVGMIDEVLQARLAGTPFKDKGIRLEDGPMGEVVVLVGSQNYNGIDAVPDPEIRSLIRAAISEWEKK